MPLFIQVFVCIFIFLLQSGLRKNAMIAIHHELNKLSGPGPSAWIKHIRRRSSLLSKRTFTPLEHPFLGKRDSFDFNCTCNSYLLWNGLTVIYTVYNLSSITGVIVLLVWILGSVCFFWHSIDNYLSFFCLTNENSYKENHSRETSVRNTVVIFYSWTIFLTNRLSEWFNHSLFGPEWINVFEQFSWKNDSMNHS